MRLFIFSLWPTLEFCESGFKASIFKGEDISLVALFCYLSYPYLFLPQSFALGFLIIC